MKIYLAAPIFNPSEREFNLDIANIFESHGITVFLPQRDGILIENEMIQGKKALEYAINLAYKQDLNAISESSLVFAILDGRTQDEGVCFEMGYALALNIPITAFKSDIRISHPWGINPMLQGSVQKWLYNKLEIIEWVGEISNR